MAHDILGMRTLIRKYYEKSRDSEAHIKSAEDGARKAREERKRAEWDASRLREENAELKANLVKEKEESASRLKEKKVALQRETAEATKLMADLAFLESEHRLTLTRSLESEERAKAATEEVAAEGKKAKIIADRAARAVEEYKSSAAFREDVADLSVDTYAIGFDDCKRSVAEMFPGLDLHLVTIPGGEEGGATDEVEDGEPLATSEAIPKAQARGEAEGDEVVEVPPPTAVPVVAEVPPSDVPTEAVEVAPPTAEALIPAPAPEDTADGEGILSPSIVSGAAAE